MRSSAARGATPTGTPSRPPTAPSSIHAAYRLDGVDDGHAGRLVRVSDEDPDVLRLLDRHGIGLDAELRLGRPGAGPLLELHVAAPGDGGNAGDTGPDAAAPVPRTLTVDTALARALWIATTVPHEGCTSRRAAVTRPAGCAPTVGRATAPARSPLGRARS